MIDVVRSYITEERLFTPDQKIILAVSGGVDSMVMLDVFRQIHPDFVVAHCNFRLRSLESEKEESFVREFCAANGIEFYVKHFDTREYAALEGISVEMAARQLRYGWFFELLSQLSFHYIATAHHLDDLVETMLINLSRGTGIRGLTGIPSKHGRIVRPMLALTRAQILAYAAGCHLPYKNDSSNDELLYQRNVIRHQIIPMFEEINPAFRRNAVKTAAILKDTARLYEQKLDEIRNSVLQPDGVRVRLSLERLKGLQPLASILFELLYPYGFNSQQVKEIIASFDGEPGKTFFSSTHRIVKDRDVLIVTPSETEQPSMYYYIEEEQREILQPLRLRMEVIPRDPGFRFSRSPMAADVDYDLLQFPLLLKKWEAGEYFQPLGMSGFKKVSDYFTDEKLSIPEKESVWILYSGRNVVWITGMRMDDRFKITLRTKKVFRIIMGEDT